MSTFDGIVQEFPYIQIDYFRKSLERPPPLVCFLSHVHSDHLQGLESFRAPFIYCSAATRELLLRIEKYPHRMNFSKGILESRRLHYKHLSKLLRPIPLNTPTEIDLTPRLSIRTTLIDANHCTGAVMFLLEGDGKAVLYTGDIRAEPWWVNSIIRNPVLIPYTLGSKQLDKMYLDNTFARPSRICRVFPTKAEGIAELLRKVETYPDNTTFYFRAWTMGYEEVWMALSAALRSKVHVDRYQMDLYRSLISSRTEGSINEAPSLCGFELGNRFVPGCLSEDERARIHSCEPGVQCSAAKSKGTIYIMPVVNRTKDGAEMPELGAGGGGGDLYQIHELELPDKSALEQLEKLCLERIHDTRALSQTRQALIEAFESKRKVLSLDSFGMKDADEIPLEKLVKILGRGRSEEEQWAGRLNKLPSTDRQPLPRVIRFPYSRHSSYSELCDLVAAFKPKDIHPCTVDPVTWTEDISMQNLFGHLCSGTDFAHDQIIRDMTTTNEELLHRRKRFRHEAPSTTPQSSQQSSSSMLPCPAPAPVPPPPPPPPYKTLAPPQTIPTTSPSPNTILTPTHATAQAHRNAICEAWTFLRDQPTSQREAHYHLGSLPSSWPTNEQNSLHSLSSEVEIEHGDRQEDEAGNQQQSTAVYSPSHRNTTTINPTQSSSLTSKDQPTPHLNPNPTATATATASESESDSDSDLLIAETLSQTDSHDEDEPEKPQQQARKRPGTAAASRRTRRKDAYLAARAGSYEAWAAVSLMSTGNNHTEEEVEL
ncbi:putative DNA repair protein [Aspergillus homomorphus CBS 101889]|uniref:Protein artemis n=1 Tax=Aspergillus homomorphus (strain CBS 101889) TaxID=1450537 RepID=A0A395IBH2_ASPHC|nr:hypothetical protein BO97DRAFT_381105 [Aspergillus homomorphus CBS 101889]RAL17580.1 hypothetical protein BO97DRAFT_381105 [Aspergillus homomorphus CBS 101889]